MLSEFNFLSAHQSNTTVLNANAPNTKNLDIGELANITPSDETFNKVKYDFKDRKSVIELLTNDTQEWNPRFILKSHFDSVRCLKFHNKEPLIVTGSEDETIKLWNLNKTPIASNKSKFIPYINMIQMINHIFFLFLDNR